jgi:hypothetical protein
MVKEENESSREREREDKEEIDSQNSIKDLVCVCVHNELKERLF